MKTQGHVIRIQIPITSWQWYLLLKHKILSSGRVLNIDQFACPGSSLLFPKVLSDKSSALELEAAPVSLDLRGQESVPRAKQWMQSPGGSRTSRAQYKAILQEGHQMLNADPGKLFFPRLHWLLLECLKLARKARLTLSNTSMWNKNHNNKFKAGGNPLSWPNGLSTWVAMRKNKSVKSNYTQNPSLKNLWLWNLWPPNAPGIMVLMVSLPAVFLLSW